MSESSYRRAVAQQAAQAAAQSANSKSFESATLSDAQLAANRGNAQHSTGPTSDEGKAKVSLNAIKTGLTGRTVLLPCDDAAPYQALLAEYQKLLQPVGVEERALVQSIVDCRWRLDRIPGLEMALLVVIRTEWSPATPCTMRPRAPFSPKWKSAANTKRNSAICKSGSRLARRREKETAELLRLQKERKTKEAEALAQAAQAYLLATHRNQPFDLAAFGFEFVRQEVVV